LHEDEGTIISAIINGATLDRTHKHWPQSLSTLHGIRYINF